MLKLVVASLLALNAIAAAGQGFPSRPVTLTVSFQLNDTTDRYARGLAQIVPRYLGQPVVVENKPGMMGALAAATMAGMNQSDGYTITLLTIQAFRLPHMQRLSWDPARDLTQIIGLAGFTFGVVVKPDSRFKTLRDVIDFAKANPGDFRYGNSVHGGSPHLAMADLDSKTGARLLRVPFANYAVGAKALMDGKIMALADVTSWAPDVDSGALRLLATFGERRSRWNVPTAKEQGFDVLAYSPCGIAGPKGMDPKVTQKLHDAFKQALDDPEYDKLIRRLDMVDWYRSSEDYAEWVVDQFRFQRALIERTIGLGR